MTALFTINFRREAYVREVSRRRRRVVALGIWVAYFGILAVLIGFYALNGFSLARRSRLIERQTTLIRNAKNGTPWMKVTANDLEQVENYAQSTRQWRDRMERLGELLPAEARLSSVAVNPQNKSDRASRSSLVIHGEMKNAPGQDRMQGVMKIVSAMRADSVFGGGYHNIRLSSTSINEDGTAEFEIECR